MSFFVNKKKAYTYFNQRFSKVKPSSDGGWFSFVCCRCEKEKGAFHLYYDVVKCWSCGYKESILEFVGKEEDLALDEARKYIQQFDDTEVADSLIEFANTVYSTSDSGVELPDGYTPILEGDKMLGRKARAYLTRRGFDLELLAEKGFGYCVEEHEDFEQDYYGYIIIPYQVDSKLVYYIGRDFLNRGNSLRYKNPKKSVLGVGKGDYLFNHDAIHRFKTGFVVEGWSDAVTIGENAVATAGWSLSPKQELALATAVWDNIVFIADAGFYKAALKTASQFLNIFKRVRVINLDEFEAEGIGKDVNEIGMDKVLPLIHNSQDLTYEKIIADMLK